MLSSVSGILVCTLDSEDLNTFLDVFRNQIQISLNGDLAIKIIALRYHDVLYTRRIVSRSKCRNPANDLLPVYIGSIAVKNVGFRGCAALMGKVLRDAFDDPSGTERNVLREPYGALRMNTQCGNDFVSVYVRINSSFLLKLSERRKLYK